MQRNSEDSQENGIKNLLIDFDMNESIPAEELYHSLHHALQDALTGNQDVAAQAKKMVKLLHTLPFKEDEQPRFTNIESPHFLAMINAITPFVEDIEINPLIRARLAFSISCAYSSILPKSGLPIEDEYIQGSIKWRDYIINMNDELAILDPTFYLESCLYMSGIYERRAQSAFPDLALDSNHPYIKTAIDYRAKGLCAVEYSKKLAYADASQYLEQFALMLENYLPKSATLEDECVQNTIHAFEQFALFASSPSQKKYSTYITPDVALKELELTHAKWMSCITGDAEDKKKAKNIEKEYRQEVSVKGFQMWDLGEKWMSQRDSDRAQAKLGWLYHRTPKAEGQEPDYEKAAGCFLSCHDRGGYNQVRKALELPEIAAFLPEISNRVLCAG